MGTVFRAYLPLSAEEAPRRPEREAGVPDISGGGLSVPQCGTQAGTVPMVEDTDQVRNEKGYQVEG
ncbi:MAG: hypothetical protein U5R49_01930 [Deltaproteobacteria bacterium]|nr:hypothetical protein [Deltaproteobacteria bacterium]